MGRAGRADGISDRLAVELALVFRGGLADPTGEFGLFLRGEVLREGLHLLRLPGEIELDVLDLLAGEIDQVAVVEQRKAEEKHDADKNVEPERVQLAGAAPGEEFERDAAGFHQQPGDSDEELALEVEEILGEVVKEMVEAPVVIHVVLAARGAERAGQRCGAVLAKPRRRGRIGGNWGRGAGHAGEESRPRAMGQAAGKNENSPQPLPLPSMSFSLIK